MESILDNTFGNKTDVISLIRKGNWEAASKFGDHISYNAIKNEDWWWNQIAALNHIDKEVFNSCSYGNIAMEVFYGSKFPERKADIEK